MFNPVLKVGIIVLYVLLRVAIIVGKLWNGQPISGQSIVLAVRNVQRFWASGNIVDLTRGGESVGQ